jgi:AraC family transcriptional regulator
MSSALSSHLATRRLEEMVENRTAYSSDEAELNVYETHMQAEKVSLTFDAPVIASMIEGKKIMHLPKLDPFEFLPGESVVVPGGQTMVIDFPEADMETPTRCLALAINPEKIKQTVNQFNQLTDTGDTDHWEVDDANFHLLHDHSIQLLIDRLIRVYTEGHPSRDVFVNFMLQELIIRLLQSKARNLLLREQAGPGHERLRHVTAYIAQHLQEDLTVDDLSEQACMSKPHFFRCFKNTFGITPVEYINARRIELARELLATTDRPLTDICYQIGFNNTSYFSRLFKRYERLSPSAYRKKYRSR